MKNKTIGILLGMLMMVATLSVVAGDLELGQPPQLDGLSMSDECLNCTEVEDEVRAYVTEHKDSYRADDRDECPWDINGDGIVDVRDACIVRCMYGCEVGAGCPLCNACDLYVDGHVNPLDANRVKDHYGLCPGC